MKRIYFAGKFKLDKNKNVPLPNRLEQDFRARLLENSENGSK